MSEESKRLAKEFSTRSRTLKALPYSDKIVEQSPVNQTLRELDVKELRFLHYLRPFFSEVESSELTYDEAVEKAAIKAGVKTEWAKKYLESKKYKEWVGDRLEEASIRLGITVEYLMVQHKANIEGVKKFSLSQLQSLDQLGERIWPKTQRIEHQVESKDSRGMDEMLKVREEVNALEAKLKDAMGGGTPVLQVMDPGI